LNVSKRKDSSNEDQNQRKGGAEGHASTLLRKEPTMKTKTGVKAGLKATPILMRDPGRTLKVKTGLKAGKTVKGD
jgi:hypothetical protein